LIGEYQSVKQQWTGYTCKKRIVFPLDHLTSPILATSPIPALSHFNPTIPYDKVDLIRVAGQVIEGDEEGDMRVLYPLP
jgi:hypothetical protein